jgi:hypothetical protein
LADGGVREGQRGERKMMVRSAWTNEGLSSGDAAGPSSAMAVGASTEQRRRRRCIGQLQASGKPGERVRGIEGSEAEVVLTGAEAARRQGMGNDKTLNTFMAGMVLRGSKARARASEMEGERGEEELGSPLLRLGRRGAWQQPAEGAGCVAAMASEL